MKSPSCSSRISKKWVKFVVEEHLKKHHPLPIPKVDIKDYSTSRGAQAGDGFNSEMVALDISATLTDVEDPDAVPTSVEYHYIIKFPSTDVGNNAINQRFHTTLKEYKIYAEIVKDLNKFQSSLCGDDFQIHVPELIYGKHCNKEFVLVLENLKYQGYKNHDKYKGLDFPHLKEAVIQLARIHALSYAYDKKQSFLEKHPFFEFDGEILKIFELLARVFLDFSIALLDSKKDQEELVKKLVASKERMLEQFPLVAQSNPNNPTCLIHGDYWNNNIMYKNKSEEGEAGERNDTKFHCKIVDWANAGWGSPVGELQYLMHTSTTLETRKEHLEALRQCYHSVFSEITTKAGTPAPNWSYEDFTKEWQRVSLMGFMTGVVVNLITLSKSNPMSKSQSPSVLDHTGLRQIKFIVNGLQLSLAKILIPLMFKPFGMKVLSSVQRKIFVPIREELLSGSNEELNERIVNLILEADDKGLFDE